MIAAIIIAALAWVAGMWLALALGKMAAQGDRQRVVDEPRRTDWTRP